MRNHRQGWTPKGARAPSLWIVVWTDVGLLQRKMLMWRWKTAESPLSEMAGVTVSRSDSGPGEKVAQCAPSLVASVECSARK